MGPRPGGAASILYVPCADLAPWGLLTAIQLSEQRGLARGAGEARPNGGACDAKQVRPRKPQAGGDRVFAADGRAHVLRVVGVEGDRDASGDELMNRVLGIRTCAAEEHIARQTVTAVAKTNAASPAGAASCSTRGVHVSLVVPYECGNDISQMWP